MLQLIFTLLFSLQLQAKTIHIAVIDSGLPKFETNIKLCAFSDNLNRDKLGVFDITNTDVYDKIGHGTNILGILEKELRGVDYCVYVIKVYDDKWESRVSVHMIAYTLALLLPDVDIINYSSSSPDPFPEEYQLLKRMKDRGILMITAAGNLSKDLDQNCDIYPACYNLSNIISVGNGIDNLHHAKTSDYGKIVKAWHDGQHIRANGITMSGTSQSTPFETAERVKKMYNQK